MKGIPLVVTAVAALALPAIAVAGASPVPRQLCQVRFEENGPLFDGVGMTVRTPSGNNIVACRVRVPPPPGTVVTTLPGRNGDVLVITRSGVAIVIFRSSSG
jgi:hypothetical protein